MSSGPYTASHSWVASRSAFVSSKRRLTRAARKACRRFPDGSAPISAAQGAAESSQRTGIPSATGGATALSSSASALSLETTFSSSAGCADSGVSVAICSFVSGPRRNDIAQRVEKSSGLSRWALWSRNWRCSRPPIAVSSAATSTPPAAERSPSSTRSLSRSVCRRPMNQLPAFAIAL